MALARILATTVGLALIAVGCSVGTDDMTMTPSVAVPVGDAVDASEVASEPEVFDAGLYCDGLRQMIEAMPVGAVTDDALAEFADAIDRAAEFAPTADRLALNRMAESNRNPQDLTLGAALLQMGRAEPIYVYAIGECGLSVPGMSLDDDGSIDFSISAGFDSGPIQITGDAAAAEAFLLTEIAATLADRPVDPAAAEDVQVEQINEQAPDGLRFEWQSVSLDRDGEYTARALVPTGWELRAGIGGQKYGTPDFGFWTEYELSTGCQGACVAQDWSLIVDDPDNSPYRSLDSPDEIVVLVNQELDAPAGRLVVHRDLDDSFAEVHVKLVRWSNAADKYLQCEAELDEDDAELWPVFADACLAATADWF